ncbi:hypothetical protein [Streptomyces sp. GQFP]|uniref:hypothetical protein n=1 Tax=Streptomyces sp. GQFP TaxID=2907545 RepID=UPI001F38EC71|nr:hypothetical protein [Streptomyces sp. GQFP]UIX34347.1 hypothetical protein LUX31_32480 [Streptomyces sp. GQFP]
MSETHEHLFNSARRWAETALDSYSESADPDDSDFAIHHMAVAIEHLCKSYLASVDEALLTQKERLTDADRLALSDDKTLHKLRTVSGKIAMERAEEQLSKPFQKRDDLDSLRDNRNGLTHMGSATPSDCRQLLTAGILCVEQLLPAISRTPESFWERHHGLSKQIVEMSVGEQQLRYDMKVRKARKAGSDFTHRLGSTPDREALKASLASAEIWGLSLPMTCPACESQGSVRGREWTSGDPYDGEWFLPRQFTCLVCGLDLSRDELELAGMTMQRFSDYEDDPSWEPDTDPFDG